MLLLNRNMYSGVYVDTLCFANYLRDLVRFISKWRLLLEPKGEMKVKRLVHLKYWFANVFRMCSMGVSCLLTLLRFVITFEHIFCELRVCGITNPDFLVCICKENVERQRLSYGIKVILSEGPGHRRSRVYIGN